MSARGHGPTVVLVGRPNVGKSTLFNRITGRRRSIVAPVAGTTRDALEGAATWQGRSFTLMDTGGLFGATTDPLHALVAAQGLKALDAADLLVFVLDGQEGLVPADEVIAKTLRTYDRPVIVAVNKTDDKTARARAVEFHRLGFTPVIDVSAEHGDGVAELLDEIVGRSPAPNATKATKATKDAKTTEDTKGAEDTERTEGTEDAKSREDDETSVAIVGRPNVGKSSLVNRLAREERVMVSEMPGTTRDTVDVLLQWHKQTFRLVDTAGMRRPGKVAEAGQVEAVSVVMAKRAMERADVAVVVVDATEGAGDREAAIAGEAERAGCGVIIAVNKWDLVKGQGQDFVREYDDRLRFQLKFLDYAPLLHLSALTGERTPKLLEAIDRVATARRKRVSTSELNRFLEEVTAANPPVSKQRRDVRILYAAQTAVAPPAFVFFTNVASELHFSYERFLVNKLREAFGFEGTPIRIKVRKRSR